MEECTVEVCGRISHARGYCKRHYDWARERNFEEEPEYKVGSQRNINPPETCSVDGCNDPYYSKGYCKNHYQYNKRTGEKPRHKTGQRSSGQPPTINVSDISKPDMGWLAGIIDGEGCIDKHQGRTRIRVANTDPKIISKLQSIANAPVREVNPKKENHKKKWVWEMYRQSDVDIVLDIIDGHTAQYDVENGPESRRYAYVA